MNVSGINLNVYIRTKESKDLLVCDCWQKWIEIEINYNQVFVNGTNYLFEVNERQDNKEAISCCHEIRCQFADVFFKDI